MSSFEKLMKILDTVRASVGHITEDAKGEIVAEFGASTFYDESLSTPRATKSVASFASTLSQQGQLLLRKSPNPITPRDKLSLIQLIHESVVVGSKTSPNEAQKFLSVGIESLMILLDDSEPDVRMNADEALNKIIWELSEAHSGKIQLELFKEIKKNGPQRCLRGALVRFGHLCHYTRPQKCRAYVQNIFPYLCKIATRPEENVLETLVLTLELILPILGNFTNDSEIRNLLKTFLFNLPNPSAIIRRASASSLILVCQHSKKPPVFFLWLLDALLQLVIPIKSESSSSTVLGVLNTLRLLVPHFPSLQTIPDHSVNKDGAKKGAESGLSFDQTVQVYEICVHYLSDKDHNIVTASLEALQAMLQSPCSHLVMALTQPEGIGYSRITTGKPPSLSSRADSQISICPLQEEENNLDSLSDICSNMEIGEGGVPICQVGSLESPQSPLTAKEDVVISTGEKSDKYGETVCSEQPQKEDLEDFDAGMESSVYSDIEIGTVSDTSILLGRKDVDFEESSISQSKRKGTLSEEPVECDPKGSEETLTGVKMGAPVEGDIGSFFDEDAPIKYLVRCLSKLFLLSGQKGVAIDDRHAKVSSKVLAVNCLGLVLPLWNFVTEPMFVAQSDQVASDEAQNMHEVLLLYEHSDPKLVSSVASFVGRLIRANLVSNDGHYRNNETQEMDLDVLLHRLCQLLNHDSSIVVRGSLTALKYCLEELLHSEHASVVLPVVECLELVVSNSYWLVKVELCELLQTIPFPFLDYLESSNGRASVYLTNFYVQLDSKIFSHRVVTTFFLPLLGDKDHKVRKAAAGSLCKLVPHLFIEGDIVLRSTHLFCTYDLNNSSLSFENESKTLDNSDTDARRFDKSKSNFYNEKNLGKLVQILSSLLFKTSEKYLRSGCLEAMSELCVRYPPFNFPKAWGCHLVTESDLEGTGGECLVSLLLYLSGESMFLGDLSSQRYILKVCSCWFAGRASMILMEQKHTLSEDEQKPWAFLRNERLGILFEKFVLHILKILSVYLHVLEGVLPSIKTSLATVSASVALSPIKKIGRQDSASKIGQYVGKGEKSDDEKSSRLKRNFAHIPEYVKLYDIVRAAHTNCKLSLGKEVVHKFTDLLSEALHSLGSVLEFATIQEFNRLSEEILQGLISMFSLLPNMSVLCGQKLLQCLFGTNHSSTFSQQMTLKEYLSPESPESLTNTTNDLNTIVFTHSSSQFSHNLQTLSEGNKLETLGSDKLFRKRNSVLLRKGGNKSFLSGCIRQFEPLVIKALKLYTVTLDVTFQKSVLDLLINLVKIRVNYCLLDSEQIFIGYVIKQFELIEEGQLKDPDRLISSIFNFLVMLSYEKYHSKNIINVPKIIQLCDGLMASGQPPPPFCVLAFRPLVEDLFLERSEDSGTEGVELDTQKEVMFSMLLKLVHHHHILKLISIILVSTSKSHRQKWQIMSNQVVESLLSKLSSLQINIDSKDAVSALEEVFFSVCPSVYQSLDVVIKSLLSSPCDIESTEGVERWIGGVLILLKVLVIRVPEDAILNCLNRLGVSMTFSKPDSESLSRSIHESLSPKRFHSPSLQSSLMHSDPLNVTQLDVQPQFALSRFFLEVIRVGANELRTLELIKYNGYYLRSSGFLHYLIHEMINFLIYLKKEQLWDSIMESFLSTVRQEADIMSNITESFICCARRHPEIALKWCQLLSEFDITSSELWSGILRSHPGKIGTQNQEKVKKIKVNCLSLEFLRRSALLAFADHIRRHNEAELLTWFLIHNISDVVHLRNEIPVRELMKYIYSSSAASSLLIQAFHARCDSVSEPGCAQSVISLVSEVHPSQSGSLLIFLIEKLMVSPLVVVSRLAASVCTQRLNYMLSDERDTSSYLPINDMKNALMLMKKYSLHKRYNQVYCLLQQLSKRQKANGSQSLKTDSPVHTEPGLSWYLDIVKRRCNVGEGGGSECAQLLSHLDYDDILTVMSSKNFNLNLLPQIIRYSCNVYREVATEDKVQEDNKPYQSLFEACKVVVLNLVTNIASLIPALSPFNPVDESSYSNELIHLFSSDAFDSEKISSICLSLIQLLEYSEDNYSIDTGDYEDMVNMAVLILQFIHFQCFCDVYNVSLVTDGLCCINQVLKDPAVISLLAKRDKTPLVSSMISSLIEIVQYICKPNIIPALPSSMAVFMKDKMSWSSSDSAVLTIMKLVQWFERNQDKCLPSTIAYAVRGIVTALGRTPVLNLIVRFPPELWSMGWKPEVVESEVISLPPIPAEYLQEADVLKQFIYRISFFGFVGKQQFEETWMVLLSVLNLLTRSEQVQEELPYINQSLALCVRGITCLLIQTLLSPFPGNPHNSSLFQSKKEKAPMYLSSKEAAKLQNIMHELHSGLKEVKPLIEGGPSSNLKYSSGQLSVDFLASSVLPKSSYGPTVLEIEKRESQLKKCGVDVHSCIQFLIYHYTEWLNPIGDVCSSVLAEIIKSVCILSDLFTDLSHHKWVLETFVPIYSKHSRDDYVTVQYITIATCKALATLKSANQDLNPTLTESVLHIVDSGLKNVHVAVRTCTLRGILYLLQAADPENSAIVHMAATYINKCKDGKDIDIVEDHEIAVWEVWLYLVENFASSLPSNLPTTALQMALTTAASSSTSPRVLRQVLLGVERLILIQESSVSTVEVVLKLVMDVLLNSTPAQSLAVLQLFLTALHCSTRNHTHRSIGSGESIYSEDLASDPEILLQFMEKLSILFDKIRICLPFEADVLARLLGTCLLNVLPASQLLNKVITEYISSHQPHPHLLAATLFQIFEAAMKENGHELVQEWVLLSLSNFTQRSPLNLAVWCLTCFFISASANQWLRSVFPTVQMRVGKLEESDISVFCLSAIYFRNSLGTQLQRTKFDDVFQSAASPGTPFERLYRLIQSSSLITPVHTIC